MRLSLVLLLTACAGAPGIEAPAEPPAPEVPAGPETLQLALTEMTDARARVDVYYTPREDQVRPRIMELRVAIGDGLRFVSATPLDAAVDAGKQLIAREEASGEVRLLLLSTTNLNTVDAGPILGLELTREGAGPTTVEIAARMPIFAPAAANDGVLLPEPLVVGGP